MYDQLSEEAYYDYKWHSEQAVEQINNSIHLMLEEEENRPYGDYQFFKWVDDPLTNKKEKIKSPLALYDNITHIPGYIGHFQLDSTDQFCTPILPHIAQEHVSRRAELEWDELSRRLEKKSYIHSLLISNDLISVPNERELSTTQTRQEESYSSNNSGVETWHPDSNIQDNYTAFLVEIDPFQWKRGSTGHYFFYRKVWRKNKRFVQGFIVEEEAFLRGVIAPALSEHKFATDMTLQVFPNKKFTKSFIIGSTDYRSNNIHIVQELDDQHHNIGILATSLKMPLEEVNLSFSTNDIPVGPSKIIVDTVLGIFALVITVGVYLIYCAGRKQIALAEERLNFVSSVSHELKTPLTSILMYSEMLKEGIVTDTEKQSIYYNFIFFESERLSRLINNVLQLSSLGKTNQTLVLEPCSIAKLLDLTRSKTSTLVEKNNLQLHFITEGLPQQQTHLLVNQDAFVQIVINLVDNAIKFAINNTHTETFSNQLDIGFRLPHSRKNAIEFFVRDYGPGVESAKARKIFDLFYRVGDELTRATPGTGIGLALVNELAIAMRGKVELIHRQPGAEFSVTFATTTT